MKNLVLEKMLAGGKTFGCFFETGSATVAECLGLAGLDYIIIDTEHGPFDPLAALDFVRAAKLYGTSPFVRVDSISRPSILKALDVGAMGLIIPNVKTLEDAEAIVEYGKYFPLGKRGVAGSAGSGFWYEDYASYGMENYFETSNRETMLIPQCETTECLSDLERIVATPGIDGIFVGPYDLSTAMGIPGQFGNAEFLRELRHISQVCRRANKPSFIYAADMGKAREFLEMGYGSVSYSMDATVLIEAFKSLRRELLGGESEE